MTAGGIAPAGGGGAAADTVVVTVRYADGSLAATHRVCFAAARSLRTGRPVAVGPAS